ncbi:MAG TPA: TA system VapC family ribonuclease toxin [Verrucomicrobiae bacterium]|nr:TA system VapC family ribonuclease toxin [Verrucomicrobiae bacterium]
MLDTNLLLALAWPNHQFHAQAHDWFAAHAKRGWATCAFTQLGFIRLSSNPAYSKEAVSPQDAAALLRQWTKHKTHHFWNSPAADTPSIYLRTLGHQQVNDAWLVEVARKNKGKLVTLDTHLSAHATEGGLVETIIS